jgi:hypothetical protein
MLRADGVVNADKTALHDCKIRLGGIRVHVANRVFPAPVVDDIVLGKGWPDALACGEFVGHQSGRQLNMLGKMLL